MPSLRRLTAAVLLAAATLSTTALTASADAAPKRIVALEWEYLEDVVSLGVTPVGGADIKGYNQWVSIALPGGVKDVGTRQQPNIERIAKLRPDLIIVPKWRVTKNLSQLKKVAKVLVLDPYPSGASGKGAQYTAMVRSFRKIAKAVGKPKKGEAVLDDLQGAYKRLKQRLADKKRKGVRIALAQPAGTASSPQLRLFTDNSLVGGVLSRLGLKNSWDGGSPRYGFSTTGLEALTRVEDGWFGFVFPQQYKSQVRKVEKLKFFKGLKMVKRGRVRNLSGDTWVFGGPRATKLLAYRIVDQLVAKK